MTLPSIYALTSSQLTVTGVISGNTPLVKSGNGTLVLAAANTFGQAFNVTGGTAVVTGSLDPLTPTSLSSGTTLKGTGTMGVVNAMGGGTVSPGLSVGTLTTKGITFGATSTYAAEINGTYSYDTIVSQGPVAVGGTLSVSVPDGTDFEIPSFITLIQNDSAMPVSGTFSGLAEGATISSPNGYQFSVSYVGGDGNDVVLTRYSYIHYWTGAVSSAWSVPANWQSNSPPVPGDSAQFGAGAVNLVATNDFPSGIHFYAVSIYSAGYTINLNNPSLDLVVADFYNGTSTVTIGATLASDMSFTAYGAASNLVVNGTVTGNGTTVSVGGDGPMTFGATLNGSGGLAKYGNGTTILTSNNGYTGPTSILAGALEIQSPQALGSPAAGTSVAAGAGLWVAGDLTLPEPLVLDGMGASSTGALRFRLGTSVVTGPVNVANPVWIVTDGLTTGTLSGVVSGAGITKKGTGRLVLAGANTFAGFFSADGGIVQLAHPSALGSTAVGTAVNPGTTLELSGGLAIGAEALGITLSGFGGAGALHSVSGANSWAGAIQLNGDASIGVSAGTLTLNGAVSGVYYLAKGGPGTLVLNANDNYTG
ncbi:MAG TPA: autotransporter-associated beta strand repeat-containing protein, partial [Thermoanaerobaculia bacterium]|nr:autotransporter-associated beta strand repeat-containing protein [Thermoanaerobaculia bacterium]